MKKEKIQNWKLKSIQSVMEFVSPSDNQRQLQFNKSHKKGCYILKHSLQSAHNESRFIKQNGEKTVSDLRIWKIINKSNGFKYLLAYKKYFWSYLFILQSNRMQLL